MARINYKRFAGYVTDADKDAANAAAALAGGNFGDPGRGYYLFDKPCYPEPGSTPTHWGTIVRLDPDQRANLKQKVITDAGITVVFDELEARGPRYPDAYDLFLGEHQLRRAADGFVHSTGLFRVNGSASGQTVTDSPQLVSQWTSTRDMRNVTLDGTNNRLQIDYAGNYHLEFILRFVVTGDTFRLRFGKNTEYLTDYLDFSSSPATAEFITTGAAVTDKFGVSVEVASGSASFKLNGGWFGINRVA